jgi:hypothetical protein
MAINARGIIIPADVATEQRSVVTAYVREVFVNEAPLVARLRRRPAEGETFNIISYDVRGRDYTLTAAFADTTGTTLTISDVSPLLVGDVLEVDTERLEITGGITITNTTTGAGTATVRRGASGTTAATHTNGAAVKLIGNSRTGGEIDQEASRNPRSVVAQYVQEFQFPVQVGGKAELISNVALPAGVPSLYGAGKQVKLVEMIRDMDYNMVYSMGEAPSTGGRVKMKGLKQLIDPANIISTTATGFTPLQFVTDLVQKCMSGGGAPDVALVSNDFAITGLTTWALPIQKGIATTTQLNLPIEEFTVPFLGGVPIRFIRSPQLKAGTAIVLTSSEVGMPELGPERYNERGNRGHALEGEWLADVSIELINPKHHAMREGISTYAAA